MKKTTYNILSFTFIVSVFLPVIAQAQTLQTYFNLFTLQATTIVGILVKIAIAIAMLVFIWGLVVFIAQSGNEQAKEEGKRKMIWGIVALFVIVSVWGLVSLLQLLTGAGGGGTPTAPPLLG